MKAKVTISGGIPDETSTFEELKQNVISALTSFAESGTDSLIIEIKRKESPFKQDTEVWVHGFDYGMPIKRRGRILCFDANGKLYVYIIDEAKFPTPCGGYRQLKLEPVESDSDLYRIYTNGGGYNSPRIPERLIHEAENVRLEVAEPRVL